MPNSIPTKAELAVAAAEAKSEAAPTIEPPEVTSEAKPEGTVEAKPETIIKPIQAKPEAPEIKPKLKGHKLSKPHLRLRMPPQLRRISRHLSTWIVIAGLLAVTAETIYIFNRGPDPQLQQMVRQRYSVPTASFNQSAINRLNSLLPPAQIPPATGKPNPFVP